MEQHVHLEPHLRAGARLRHTIQAAAILRMNVEDLYDYLSQTAESNPMMTVSRDESRYVPLRRPSRPRENGAEPWDFAPRQQELSLRAHLLQQLPLATLGAQQERIVRCIIDELDSSGYFTESAAALAQRFQVDRQTAENCLALVRSLEPAGVAAAGLQECLLIQLRALPERSPLAEKLVEEHWALLTAQSRPRALAVRLGYTQENIQAALHLIGSLNPRPSNGFSGEEMTAYVTPDAYLLRQEEQLLVLPAPCCTLQLDAYYQSLRAETDDQEVRQYLSRCARQAEELIHGLRQREELLLRIFTEIVQAQREFFLGGVKAPLQQLDLAQTLGLSTSTISRAVQNKYLHYWGGLLPVRSLFSRPLSPGSSISVHAVKIELERLIQEEDKSHPYSDRLLCLQLEERGMVLSRRLLTKYREQLGIAPAFLRREPRA